MLICNTGKQWFIIGHMEDGLRLQLPECIIRQNKNCIYGYKFFIHLYKVKHYLLGLSFWLQMRFTKAYKIKTVILQDIHAKCNSYNMIKHNIMIKSHLTNLKNLNYFTCWVVRKPLIKGLKKVDQDKSQALLLKEEKKIFLLSRQYCKG